jgi:hypothetical protein
MCCMLSDLLNNSSSDVHTRIVYKKEWCHDTKTNGREISYSGHSVCEARGVPKYKTGDNYDLKNNLSHN